MPLDPLQAYPLPDLRNLTAYWADSFRTLLDTEVGFENTPEDDRWRLKRELGRGGYGMVTHWQKYDDQNAIVDELAIKQMQHSGSRFGSWNNSNTGNKLLTEAVVQREIGLHNSANIAALRGYKCLMEADENLLSGRYRLFLEMAPYGTLSDLAFKYRYWNKSIPEAFLWHVFNSLAYAAVDLKNTPRPDSPRHEPAFPRDSELVNFDIKLSNILLAAPRSLAGARREEGLRGYDYPVLKMADFGSTFFSWFPDNRRNKDGRNPESWFTQGTDGCQPPEQIHYGAIWPRGYISNQTVNLHPFEYNLSSPFYDYTGIRGGIRGAMGRPRRENLPPNWEADVTYNFTFDSKLHVWAIGKVMYDLLRLMEPRLSLWQISTDNAREFRANQNHQIRNCHTFLFNRPPFSDTDGAQPPQYSPGLTDLIHRCLKPEWASRIDIRTLIQETGAQITRLDARTLQERGFDRLYYKEHEINRMLEGTLGLQPPYAEFERIKQMRHDPDWGSLWPEFDRRDTGAVRTHKEEWESQNGPPLPRPRSPERSLPAVVPPQGAAPQLPVPQHPVPQHPIPQHPIIQHQPGPVNQIQVPPLDANIANPIDSAVTDPTDGEYDVALRYFRDGRRNSYYRLKPSGLRDSKKLRRKNRRRADMPTNNSTYDYAKGHKVLRRARQAALNAVNVQYAGVRKRQIHRHVQTALTAAEMPDLPPESEVDLEHDDTFRWWRGRYLTSRTGNWQWWNAESSSWEDQEVYGDATRDINLQRVGKPRLR